MSGITENLTGIVSIEERHEMTAYDDFLNITDATITLIVVPGDLFTNEGNDTVTIINSVLNGVTGTSLFLGSGDDSLSLKNVTLNLATLTGNGTDYVSIVGDAQSLVSLSALASGETTLSLGSGSDTLEIASTLTGAGTLDFGDGVDTLYFNGGKLTVTGAVDHLENLSVSSQGGTLGRDLTLSGSENTLTFNGNLTGTDSERLICVTGTTSTLKTTNNVKLNVGLSISNSVFTHTEGGTLEISDSTLSSAVTVTNSTVGFHDFVMAKNAVGIRATSSTLTLENANISNHTGSAISTTSGALTLKSASISNNKRALRLYETTLTGNDLTFSQNSDPSGSSYYAAVSEGGAIWTNSNADITKATFNRNYTSAYDDSYYRAAFATAKGGALFATGGLTKISNASFSGNVASARAKGSRAEAMGGAIFAVNGQMTISDADFIGNYTSASAPSYSGYSVSAMGGAVYVLNGNLTLNEVNFKNNYASSYTSAAGGALFSDNSIVNMTDVSFTGNYVSGYTSAMGGAIGVSGNSTVTYTATEGTAIKNLGNGFSGWSGGFLYLADSGSKFIFDLKENAQVTIGDANDRDSFAGLGTISKSGAGYLLINSTVDNELSWTISEGTLELARIARNITLDKWTIGVGTMLKLSSLNDTITMGTDKNIGIIDLGGGSDVINTTGYTLSGGELRISTLTFTGGGIVKSAISTRDVNAGFDLTLANVKLESTITGGNAADVIKITQESIVKGAMSLGGGDDVITASAKATFENTLNVGDGNNVLTFSTDAVFEQGITGGDGNDKITLNGQSTLSGVLNLGKGTNTVAVNRGLTVDGGVQLTDGGATTIIVNRDTVFTNNTIQAYFDEKASLTAVAYDWSGIADLDKVRIVVSNDETFATYEFAIELYNQSKTFTLYTESSNFIQFQAQDEDGWKQRILPDTTAPDQVTGLTLRGENGVAIGAWEAAHDNIGGNGVKQYNIQVATDSSFSNPVGSYSSTDTAYSFTGISDGSYYWRVQAEDYTGNQGIWSTAAQLEFDTTAPTSPRNLKSTVGTYSVKLSWTASTDSGSGVKEYEYRIGTASDFSTITVSGTAASNQDIQVNDIAYGSYYWEARAVDQFGNVSDWSFYRTFTVGDAIAPTSPSELDYLLQGESVTLDWLASGDESLGSGLKGYELELAADAAFTNVVSSKSALTETRTTIGGLSEAVYYARVRASDNAGNKSEWSNVQNFIVGDPDIVPPGNPAQLNAAVHARTVTLTWNASTDDKSGVKEYVVMYSYRDSADILQNGTATVSVNSLVLSNAANGTYSWSVKAIDNAGNTSSVVAGDDFTVSAAAVRAQSDIDGNGVSDVMFQYTGGDYQIGFWMNGTSEWQGQGQSQPTDWELLGAYDMDGNGKAEAVMRGNVQIGNDKGAYIGYYKDGDTTQWQNISFLNNPDEIEWNLAIGNLTGNEGQNSIVWHAPGLNALGVWTDGTSDWIGISGGFDSTWKLTGTGDFNGDGKDEILFAHDGNLYTTDIESNFTSLGGWGTAWEVRAIGDFSGDGKDDLVLFHSETGSVVKCENGQASDWSSLGQLDASDWFIVGAGDYNGDKKDDLLVRQYSTGMLGYYSDGDMNQWNEMGRGVDMNWSVIA